MKKLKRMDFLLLALVLIMTLFGIVMIFSASSASTVLKYNVKSTNFFIKQALALALALFGGLIIFFLPKSWYKAAGVIGLGGSFVTLLVVLISGEVHGNAASWLSINGSKFQPAEFAKSFMIIFMATYYGFISKYNIKLSRKEPSAIKIAYFIPLCIGAILCFLILRQPDMGSAIIFIMICALTYLCIPYVWQNSKKLLIPLIWVGLAGVLLIFALKGIIFTDEQLSRFEFTKPCTRYQEDTGYQVCNGLIAISNGGLFGVGLGNSTQKYLYLPESHTDFIFPIICEECGSLIGFLIILTYAFILLRIYKIAREADDIFNKIIAFGTLWFLTLHIIINLFGVLSLMPITGVPLPFLSYGGSFLLNAIVLIFMTERVSSDNKSEKLKKEIANMSKYKGR